MAFSAVRLHRVADQYDVDPAAAQNSLLRDRVADIYSRRQLPTLHCIRFDHRHTVSSIGF